VSFTNVKNIAYAAQRKIIENYYKM